MHNKRFKTNAPFGIATKRFTKVGFHPELDRSGAMKKEITKTGPGSYYPQRAQCKSKQGMGWKHKLEVEEFSKFLGYRNSHILRERQFFKSMRGPGTNDLNEELYQKKSASVYQDKGFGSEKRFGINIYGQGPPPDTYFKNISEKMEQTKKTFSKLPTFEWDGLADRFKSHDSSHHLAPNRYAINDGKNMADVLSKVVSSRGPYDCFTGPRDGTTIKNYFAPPLSRGPDYFYIKPSDFDHILHHSSKEKYGLFLKNKRFPKKPTVRSMLNDLSLCYRNPNDPGPASYDISTTRIKKVPSSRHPFNSSNIYARPPTDWRISPGPGRYNPKPPRCMKVKRPSWVFLSKQDRTLYKVVEYTMYA